MTVSLAGASLIMAGIIKECGQRAIIC